MQKRIQQLHSVLLSGTCLTAAAVATTLASSGLSAQVLEEVIVTARKRAEVMQDVPVSVTAFTGNQLRNAGITNLKDLGLQTPGLQIDQSSAAQIWIRGIGQRDDGSRIDAPVGVYIDGLYIPRKDGQLLDLLDVQSVQVLRGPQGTLFGKNTIGGAINVFRTAPTREFGGKVQGTLGEDGRQAGFDADKARQYKQWNSQQHDGWGQAGQGFGRYDSSFSGPAPLGGSGR